LGKRGQVILRHTELAAYRCFLPDLAGFTGFCRTGPGPFLLFWVYLVCLVALVPSRQRNQSANPGRL